MDRIDTDVVGWSTLGGRCTEYTDLLAGAGEAPWLGDRLQATSSAAVHAQADLTEALLAPRLLDTASGFPTVGDRIAAPDASNPPRVGAVPTTRVV